MGLFRKQKPLMSRDEALACIPVKSEAITSTRTPEGLIRLRYPLVVKPWIAQLGRRFGAAPGAAPSRQLELDQLGSLTWELIDGQRSVRAIVRHFVQRTQVHPKEAEAAVTRFLRELGRRGIVGMAPGPATHISRGG
jgi:hypothetical protein